jgi:CO dehydrogenase/acetyl-CoA synthase beta subunit
MNELLLEVATRQQELSQDMKHLQADGTARAEEDEDEEEEEEEEEEGEEPSHLPPNQATTPAVVSPNSVAIHGFSFSNGSGHMYNSNVGNIINNNISNVGNNNSRNYYG